MSEPHILVVDDHRDIRESLASYLRKHGMRVSQAAIAAAARDQLEKNAIDLIVLDIRMPGEDGLSLCRHIREAHDTPIIVLSALADDTDRIVGLEVGADDYVTKPFNPRELLARVKNVLRRANTLPKKQRQTGTKRYVFDRWILDIGRRELIGDDGVALMLSSAEFHLLLALVERPRLVLSRDRLLDLTSGRGAQPFDRSIDNQISRLRRKVERDPADPQLIKTVWGVGYLLAADVEEAS
ncbi:response regulator [Bradyrhizobium sp. DOA9]|uniref:response regulator n=1 Tax=Bradyrhizobium sp. DOA9 TaxID=1126627 RepID=UPI000468F9AA|nr:response regulator [Bradyrhizobium sp. DOA9]GAJ37829.1 transcriptional regulatory protein ompR [Bradyrhizobium sp. DOA9]